MELQIFNNPQFGDIRTAISENREPLFCLADICRSLEVKNVSDCKSSLDEEGIVTTDTLTGRGIQKMIFVNESNFYQVVFQSRKPEAKQFKKWVTSEVLPSSRKNGMYANDITVERIIDEIKFANYTRLLEGFIKLH